MLRVKKSQLKSIFINTLFLIIFAFIVSSIGGNDVVLLTPPNGTWTNDTINGTAGFNFTWRDGADSSIEKADCTLFILNITVGGDKTNLLTRIVDNENLRNTSFGVGNNTVTTLSMNATGPGNALYNRGNNSENWWTVRCENVSSSPTRGYPSPFVVFHDSIYPNMTNMSDGFTDKNNTWITSPSELWIEINVTDNADLQGKYNITCEMTNNSQVFASAKTTTSTGLTPTTSLNLTNSTMDDGIYDSIRYQCRDPAGNINKSFHSFNLSLDSTLPVISFNNGTPEEGNNLSSGALIEINFTVTDLNIEIRNIIVEFDGANRTMNASALNCAATSPFTGYNCNVTNASVGDKKDYKIVIYANDSAGTAATASRTFSVDSIAPRILTILNWTSNDSIVDYSFTINDTTPGSCIAKIFDRNSNLITTLNGTLGDSAVIGGGEGTLTNCTGTFNETNIIEEGAFTVKFNATDGVNNTNETSKGGIFTRLYTGWNLVTNLDGDTSNKGVCDTVAFCDQTSWFNNTGGSKIFKTFSNSTPSVNAGTNVPSGDGIHIHTTQNTEIITNDNTPDDQQETVWNFSLTVPGWNVMGLLTNTSVNATYSLIGKNATTNADTGLGLNMTYSSWLNASAEKYYSCKRSLLKCSATSVLPIDINLRKGYGVWVLVPANYTVNRSTIFGG